jgi:hypothetical protein
LWLALKSGNFGGPDFFAQALALAASLDDATEAGKGFERFEP